MNFDFSVSVVNSKYYICFQDVNVTIIQSANFLVTDTLGQKFQKNLQQKLQKMGVNLVLGMSYKRMCVLCCLFDKYGERFFKSV